MRKLLQRAVSSVRGFFASDEGSFTLSELLGGFQASSVTEPMRQNTWVYSAVQAVTKTLASGECRLVRGDGEGREVRTGRAFELLNRPSPTMSCQDLIEEITGHLVTGGEAHVFDPTVGNLRPRELVVAGRKNMSVHKDAVGRLRHWEYFEHGQRIRLHPEWNNYVRLFNPYDRYRGLSPLEAAALGINQDHQASVYNDRALTNGGRPGGYWKFPQGLSKEQAREYMDIVNAQVQGVFKANTDIVAGGGAEYAPLGFKNVDLQLYEGRKMNREEIYAALGVPPVLANVFDSAHYNVADAAQEIFLINTILPLAAKVEGLFNTRLLPAVERGVRLVIDFSTHHVMVKIQRDKIESLNRLTRTGTPYNEAVTILDLPLERRDWGEESFMESGVETTEQIREGLSFDDDSFPAEADQVSQHEAQAEQRAEELAARRETPRIQRIFRKFFARQEALVIERLAGVPRGAQAGFGFAGSSDAERVAARVLLDLQNEQSLLRQLVADYFPQALERAVRARLKELGFSGARVNRVVREMLAGRRMASLMRLQRRKIAGIELVTRRRLQRTLIQGIEQNETVAELGERVRQVLGDNIQRANLIARNEAGQAVATGRYIASRAAGTQAKGWLHGANPRPTHVRAQVRYHPTRHPIPFDQPFEVGDSSLQYPRDPAGEAREIINCNCTFVPVRRPRRAR